MVKRDTCQIDASFMKNDQKSLETLKLGDFVVIEEDVVIGENVMIGNFAYVMAGTRIGNGVRIDSYVRTGGRGNVIGDNCLLKIRTTLSPGVAVGRGVFFGPHSMVLHQLPNGDHAPGIVKDRAYIGACALVGPGVTIGQDVTLGAMSFALKSLTEPFGLYVGSPAVLKKMIK